ncbi:hypothetical protein GY14_31550 [Delftia tsuruhatensis]|nr:hypothetical protein GY14_31550 [Delftia tsuruhatensis]
MVVRQNLDRTQAAIHQRAAWPAHLEPPRLCFHDPIGFWWGRQSLNLRHAEPFRHAEQGEFLGCLRGDHLDLLEIGFA